jgi:PAS domain S-box-containing protein
VLRAAPALIAYLRGARRRDVVELAGTTREGERSGRATRDQLEAMLQGVADAVTAQAPDGRLLFANDAAVTMLGFDSSEALLAASPSDILSRFEVFDEAGRPFPLEDFPGRRALGGEEGAEAIMRFRVRGTGEERWSAVKATPIKDGAGHVTMAINVIEDITGHKRAELGQRFLVRGSSVLGAWLDSEELLIRIAGVAIPEIADWCAVDLAAEEGLLERVALTHADPALRERALELSRRYPPDPEAPRGPYEVMRTGEPQLFPEVSDELLRSSARDEKHYELLREIGVRSMMVVPMRARERMLGILTFATGPSGRRYDEHDLELAHELARRCATALDNNRLYAERSYVARTLQESLLPGELPDIPGIETAARFRHTGEGGEVGGDFYDLFETGGRGWTVVIGDVCGKGPDAAAVTALARYTLRAAAMRERLPSRSLWVLNEALLRQRRDRRFCTVAYAYLERVDGGARVGFASGGHPLPLLVHPDGEVEAIGEPGTLLGVVPDPTLADRAVSLSEGDALVFYTDGVIEGRGDGEALDEERLARLLGRCAGRSADAIAAEVERAALGSHGGRPRDDIAVLVLRVAP